MLPSQFQKILLLLLKLRRRHCLCTIYNYPFPELRKPITSVITPLICTEGFGKARQTYFQLKKDSAGAYDFNPDWLNALEFSYWRLGNVQVADQVRELNAGKNP
jgi:hypothetical protein